MRLGQPVREPRSRNVELRAIAGRAERKPVQHAEERLCCELVDRDEALAEGGARAPGKLRLRPKHARRVK